MMELPRGFVLDAPPIDGGAAAAQSGARGARPHDDRDERIVDAVVAMASQGGREDARRLLALEAQIGKDAFRRLGGFVLQKLGARGDRFSPQAFVARYERLSDVGRNRLFGAAGTPTRRALDDLVAVTKRVGAGGAQRNIKGSVGKTASNAPGDPLTSLRQAVQSAGAGLTAAAIVSRPATARAVSRWARAWATAAMQPARSGARNAAFATARQLASAIVREFGTKVNAAPLAPRPGATRIRGDAADEPCAGDLPSKSAPCRRQHFCNCGE
jgi:hypothetical protein